MEKSEQKKQFQISLYETELLITTPSNCFKAYEADLNISGGIKLKIGWHDYIETGPIDLNYHECCGVLILFGITPPTFDDLYKQLE